MSFLTVDSRRTPWIDTARGWAMLFVIIIHISSIGPVICWPGTMFNPVFFFLSGYTFHKTKTFKIFFINKVRTMIVPYFCFGIICFVFLVILDYIQGNFISFSYSFEYYFSNLLIQQRFTNLWFLGCLFILEIMFYGLLSVSDSDIFIVIASIISAIIVKLYLHFIGLALPWNIDICFAVLPYFSLGYLSKKHKEEIIKFLNNKIVYYSSLIISLTLSIIFVYLNYEKYGTFPNVFQAVYCYLPYTIIAQLSGLIFVILFSKLFPIPLIRYIGCNSMVFYACHSMVFFPIAKTILHRLNILRDHSGTALTVCYECLIIAVIIVLSTITHELISRSKLKFILGR